MLNDVVERLLDYSEKTQSNLHRQNGRNLASEVDFDVLPIAEFPAPASYTCNDSQVVQFRGMQVVRKCLHVTGDVPGSLLQCLHTAPCVGICRLEALQVHREHCQSLTDVVVKFPGNPRTFLFLRLD